MRACIDVLLVTIGLIVSSTALAAAAGSPRVNGVAIPEYRVDAAVKAQVAQGQKDTPELRNAIREILINQEVVMQDAVKKGLDKQAATIGRLELDRISIVTSAYFEDYFAKNPITDEMLRKEYERLKAQTPAKEVHVRHILVAGEDEAKEVLQRLTAGASFEKLAAERSRDDGSKARGGDVGWSAAERFPKPFADAVAALKPGQTTQTPVRTDFGYHIIRLEEERATTLPTFEQAKPQVQQLLQEQVVQKVVTSLRAQAKIEQ